MAQFELSSFIDVGTSGYHTATSWKVTKDKAGQQVIDQSIADPNNKYHWVSPLPDGNGGFYADLDQIHLWIRVHILGTQSPWFYAGVANQNDQMFKITENGKVINTVNSIQAGIQ